jgi:hypothetical protein
MAMASIANCWFNEQDSKKNTVCVLWLRYIMYYGGGNMFETTSQIIMSYFTVTVFKHYIPILSNLLMLNQC